jgi:glycerol-3-phosphate acyltransferase PlsY
MNYFLLLVISYLLGSLPTALIVSRILTGEDIREMGDGNMGARNVTHVMGWGAGIFVAMMDFGKGGGAILLARNFTPDTGWQIAVGCAAVIGHDFPIWAKFKGGQGMAATLGVLFFLTPVATSWGLVVFFLAYLVTRIFDLSAGLGLGCLAFLVWYTHVNDLILYLAVALFISIPIKKVLDWPRRKRLRTEARSQAIDKSPNSSDAEPVKNALSHQ